MIDPDAIWLQPWCDKCEKEACGDIGRQWCEDNIWKPCDLCERRPVRFVRDKKQHTPLTEEQMIKHMVDRFLGWRLPNDFDPDGGISFKRTFNDHLPQPMQNEPIGTNLFNAVQAEAMVRHMIADLPYPKSASSLTSQTRPTCGGDQK